MKIRKATVEDAQEVAKTSIGRPIKVFPNVIDDWYCIEDEDRVIAVGGVKLMNAFTAWVWFDYAAAALPKIIIVYRMTKEWLVRMMELHGIRRLMAAVEPDFPEAIRFVEHMGFKLESTMPSYFGDRPGLLYVILKGAS